MVLSSQSYGSLTMGAYSDADAKSDRQVADLESSGNNRMNSRKEKEDVVFETPFGVTLRGKNQLRAAVQTMAFGALLMGYGVFHVVSSATGPSEDGSELRLLEEEVAECANTAGTWWELLLYILGILYTFLALAIVCDEFFVPALEELSGPHRMNLSMDVAGKLQYRFEVGGLLTVQTLTTSVICSIYVFDHRCYSDGSRWVCS